MICESLVPVILSGGSGTRLWPLSRESFPKQFLSLETNNKNTLLQETYLRISDLPNLEKPILICNEKHRFIVAEQMNQINIQPQSILLEPFGRNTAPAITLAALKSLEIFKDPTLLVLSSDHVIKNKNKFIEKINIAQNYSEENRLVTFGVIPSNPNTGFGYIKTSKPNKENINYGKNILEFTEKPDKETAKEFLKNNQYLWNSGIFLFKSKTIINEIKKYNSKILDCCAESLSKDLYDLDFQRLNIDPFSNCPDVSIDVAVMEKTKIGTVVNLDAGWCDLGNWNSVWQNSKKDNHGNTQQGNVFIKKTKNSYLKSESRLVVGLGIENLFIIDTRDAVLVADKNYSEEVKSIVNHLNPEGYLESQEHRKIYRPWGHYLSIEEGNRWKVKLIFVKPGGKLSLQLHRHRSEHWVIVNGSADVEIEDKKSFLKENESIYIPVGEKHRISNPGKIPLVFIEVQSGSYLNEDDIERFKDSYGRINQKNKN